MHIGLKLHYGGRTMPAQKHGRLMNNVWLGDMSVASSVLALKGQEGVPPWSRGVPTFALGEGLFF